MKNSPVVLPLACSAAILLGLAAPAHAQTPAQTPAQGLRVEPVMSVRHSEPGLDTWYKLGRFHQENKRYDMAIEAYRQVLDHDPANVEARNALATVYSLQNRYDEAIAEFQILLKADPKLAYVYNNLGYAYFLKADYLKAISAFGNAIAIDPRNSRAFGNLVRAFEQLGTLVSPAAPSPVPAAAPAAAAAPATPAPAPLTQTKEPEAPEQGTPADTAPTADAAEASPAAQAAEANSSANAIQPALTGIVIEIANGTRDAGLGKYVANALRQEGATILRVTGLKPYTQRRNVILYRDGFHDQAVAVSRRFTNPPEVVADSHQRPASPRPNMRLVLGRSALHSTETASSAEQDSAL